jgi:hypothetical protein
MSNSPKKMSSILGYTLTGDLPSTNTFSQNGNNWESPPPKCSAYLDESQNSTSNKLFIYKAILKPIRTYGIQLWGTASTYNIEILERFQSKTLLMIVDAPWHVPNTVIRRDLQIPTVKEEIRRYGSQYSARLSAHPNDLIVNLIELPGNRQLRRHLPNDLPTRFLV